MRILICLLLFTTSVTGDPFSPGPGKFRDHMGRCGELARSRLQANLQAWTYEYSAQLGYVWIRGLRRPDRTTELGPHVWSFWDEPGSVIIIHMKHERADLAAILEVSMIQRDSATPHLACYEQWRGTASRRVP